MKRGLTPNEQRLVKGIGQGLTQCAFANACLRILVEKKPVDLEPYFQPFTGDALIRDLQKIELLPRPYVEKPGGVCFIQLWFPTQRQNNKTSWQDIDFLRELTIAKNPIYYLIMGNKEAITHILAVDIDDLLPVKNALKAKFPDMECELTLNPFIKFGKALQQISKHDFDLRDYYTGPAYWRTLAIDEDMKYSPLLSIYSTLCSLKEDEIGFYQVIFKPGAYPWSQNILNLIDTETEIRKYGNINLSNWYYSGFGKENRDKVNSTILAVAIRTGVFCGEEKIKGILNSLSLAFTNFHFGDERLNFLDKSDYKGIINNEVGLLKIITSGLVYHSGNLLNTEETSFFLHFPTDEILRNEVYKIDKLIGFRVPAIFKEKGVAIGYNDYAGKTTIVNQAERVRKNHTGIIGKIDKGKSCEMENMIMDDISKGHGVGVIDPHGMLIERVVRRIERSDIKRTIYFAPYDKEYTPCYNPFRIGKDINKTVDDNVNRFKCLFPSKAWGPNIESVLRHIFYAIAITPDLCLSDARILLSKNIQGKKLRQQILPFLNNRGEELFWIEEFKHTPSIDSVLNKLTIFLQPEISWRTFSQRENKISFRGIMDNREIFLADLKSGILGNGLTNILGSNLVSSFYDAAMSRMDMIDDDTLDSEVGVPFSLYIDEFHRYPTKSLEHSLRELRKFNLRLILAFQQKEYMAETIKSAMSNIGTWIVLELGWDDAQRFFKEFYGEIEPVNFMRRSTGDGFAKIGNDITSIKTFPPEKIESVGFKKEIIQHSREHYYTKVKKNTHKDIPGYMKKKVVYDEI